LLQQSYRHQIFRLHCITFRPFVRHNTNISSYDLRSSSSQKKLKVVWNCIRCKEMIKREDRENKTDREVKETRRNVIAIRRRKKVVYKLKAYFWQLTQKFLNYNILILIFLGLIKKRRYIFHERDWTASKSREVQSEITLIVKNAIYIKVIYITSSVIT
jgi:hypothetical protein